MSSVIRSKLHTQAKVLAVCGGVLIAGCGMEDEDVAYATQDLDLVAGDPLPGITAADFAEARDAFLAAEELDEGLGPIFNERGCGICHTQGAIGGAGVQIERRFGRFDSFGRFDDLDNRGGSLRQLFTVGPFIGANGQSCNPALEVEPSTATVRNVGRLTTPLFGAGLVESLSDGSITVNASNQPSSVRGTVVSSRVLLPNPDDPGQVLNGTRVGRFGWKAGIATLAQFAADAYTNEMGITTQHCIKGTSVLTFALESKPNGIANPPGCDDLAPPHGVAGIPAETDDVVGSCAGGLSELQDDIELFRRFMTFLAPAPRLPIDPNINLQGGTVFNNIGCAQCHLLRDYVTSSSPANGVPGNFTFRPRSDFLVHNIGTGDNIGNDGDSQTTAARLRTPPLWGLHHRTRFMHDGASTSIEAAIARHGGQANQARLNFNALSTSNRNAMLTAMRSD